MFIMLSLSNMWLIMYEMSIVPISHVNFFFNKWKGDIVWNNPSVPNFEKKNILLVTRLKQHLNNWNNVLNCIF